MQVHLFVGVERRDCDLIWVVYSTVGGFCWCVVFMDSELPCDRTVADARVDQPVFGSQQSSSTEADAEPYPDFQALHSSSILRSY